jgi:hypothetical protein
MQKHIRLAIYDLTKGTFGEVAGLAQDGMLPLFSTQPGFIEYGVADIANGKLASITVWETREQAEKSVGVASAWVRDNISDRVRLLTSCVGDLAFLQGTPVHA